MSTIMNKVLKKAPTYLFFFFCLQQVREFFFGVGGEGFEPSFFPLQELDSAIEPQGSWWHPIILNRTDISTSSLMHTPPNLCMAKVIHN